MIKYKIYVTVADTSGKYCLIKKKKEGNDKFSPLLTFIRYPFETVKLFSSCELARPAKFKFPADQQFRQCRKIDKPFVNEFLSFPSAACLLAVSLTGIPCIAMLRQPCTRERSAGEWILGVDSAPWHATLFFCVFNPVRSHQRSLSPLLTLVYFLPLLSIHSLSVSLHISFFPRVCPLLFSTLVRQGCHATLHLSRRVPAHACSHEASGFQAIKRPKTRDACDFFFLFFFFV